MIVRKSGDIELIRNYYATKLACEVEQSEVVAMVKEGRRDFVLLDARRPEDYAKGHIPGAINVPPEEVDEKLRMLGKDADYVTYCYSHQ